MSKAQILAELDRRISNVEKVRDWQYQEANAYLASLRKRLSAATLDDVLKKTYAQAEQDAIQAAMRWRQAETELMSLEALKEDVKSGRVVIN